MIIIHQNNTDLEDIVQKCVHTLSQPGAVLLLPTETVYGVMCAWNDEVAITRLREMKGRSSEKPLQMLAPDMYSVENAGVLIDNDIRKIVEAFCPGPITIVAPSENPHMKTVGFRIPAHTLMLKILGAFGEPLAATSANFADAPPSVTIQEAIDSLHGTPDLSVDAGPLKGTASTVVDMSGACFKILRHGPISEAQVRDTLL